MKATIDIPDALYRRVKAKSALRGQTVREVAVSRFQGWIAETDDVPPEKTAEAEGPPPAWFGAVRKYARCAGRHDMAAVRTSIAAKRVREGAVAATEKADQ